MSERSNNKSDIYNPKIDRTNGLIKLWGTRGSIPVSGAKFAQHGGDTSCMHLEHNNEVIIFDAGSGIRNLGLTLAAGKPRKIHLFITHTHWDHIQGFPFFAPAYLEGFDITIYGAKRFTKDLYAIFRGQLDSDYFPVQLSDMKANLEFKYLPDTPIKIGDVVVSSEFVRHPGATVGYKIEINGTTIAYVPDNEFLQGYLGSPYDVDPELIEHFSQFIEFFSDIDLLIHEAQYMPDQYIDKVHWGHTSVSNACLMVKVCRAKRWIVVHHDPLHSDDFLHEKLALTHQILKKLDYDIQVTHGFDRMTLYL